MRPGLGLVVMALAFFSGTRTGTSQSSAPIKGKLGKFSYDSSLSQINPWLSACDLAQPNTAPDLQGQCSAGTLPVAWISEGPGPPRCPSSCQKYHVKDRSNQNMNNNDNKHFNFNNNNNISHKYKIKKKDINMENTINENRQCLDYLGEDEFSPSQLCKKSSSDIETKLKSIRLRHCCERNVLSALHNTAYVDVLNGGAGCLNILTELLETDALAARITCEFTEILVRYDCGQLYSLIHNCEDCKETYRRWVCSTFIPYFATKNDLRNTTNKSDSAALSSMKSKTTNLHLVNNIDNKAQKMFKQAQMLEGSNEIKRSRRKARLEQKRIRIRPCLSVCQTVEQKCPYMLPADRAPAYPTQYAGEPTFLCLDPNIQETGEQEFKSNYGPKDCCYSYCGSPSEGLCSNTCDFIFNGNATDQKIRTAISPVSSNNYVKLENNEYIINDNTELPQPHLSSCPAMPNATLLPTQCNLSQAISKSSSSTLSPFSSSIIILIKTADYYLNINIHIKNLSNNYWTILIYNLLKFSALTKILLQLARL